MQGAEFGIVSSSTGACPLGAAEGKKNWFYLLARRAQHGDPEMAWHKMDAFDAVAAGVEGAGDRGGPRKAARMRDARMDGPPPMPRSMNITPA
jgi:hypothetical protein